MATDRVLIEIVTAANMAGVEQAEAGMLKLNASTLALGVALGVLIYVGKAAIENTEAQEKAHRGLAQAASATGASYDKLQANFDAFSEANKRYIKDQYALEEAYAALVRAGADEKTALREINDVLDLATIRSEDYSDAQKTITLALAGNSKGLKALGITTEEYNAIMKDKLLTTEQKHAALLALIESKTKDGRKAQTDLQQSSNDLNKSWQDITTKVGPPLLSLFSGIVSLAASLVDKLNNLGQNKDWNKAISDGLGHIQDGIVAVVKQFRDFVDLVHWLQNNTFGAGASGQQQGAPQGRRASGGPVLPGGTYTVGENGPETLVMGGSGGMVIANGGGGGGGGGGGPIVIHNHLVLDGHQIDLVTNTLLRRGGFAPGT